MNNYLLVGHGLRLNINNDFEESHFTVPEGFNFITFHKPGFRLFNDLGNIVADQLPNFTENIINSFKSDPSGRRNQLINIENTMVRNYLFNNLDKIVVSEEIEEDIFGNPINYYREYLMNFITDVSDISDTLDLSNSKSLVNMKIDNIKSKLNFQIRVYLQGGKAPLMNISFEGGNNNFNGLFDINNLPEHLFNKSEDLEINKILGYSLIKKDFTRSDGRAFTLDESLIEILNRHSKNGNIFIFSCGNYNKNLSKLSLFREKSDQHQGIVKKYKIYYGSF